MSSIASALCGMFDGMHSTSPAWTVDLFAIDPELQRPIEDVSQLLVVMAVFGNDASLFQEHAGQHDFLADNELTLQQRV